MGNVFKAISDPTRREILELLNAKDLSAGEIAEHLNISKPALTKHLNILREAELVSSEKKEFRHLFNKCESTAANTLRIYIYIQKKGVVKHEKNF